MNEQPVRYRLLTWNNSLQEDALPQGWRVKTLCRRVPSIDGSYTSGGGLPHDAREVARQPTNALKCRVGMPGCEDPQDSGHAATLAAYWSCFT